MKQGTKKIGWILTIAWAIGLGSTIGVMGGPTYMDFVFNEMESVETKIEGPGCEGTVVKGATKFTRSCGNKSGSEIEVTVTTKGHGYQFVCVFNGKIESNWIGTKWGHSLTLTSISPSNGIQACSASPVNNDNRFQVWVGPPEQ